MLVVLLGFVLLTVLTTYIEYVVHFGAVGINNSRSSGVNVQIRKDGLTDITERRRLVARFARPGFDQHGILGWIISNNSSLDSIFIPHQHIRRCVCMYAGHVGFTTQTLSAAAVILKFAKYTKDGCQI